MRNKKGKWHQRRNGTLSLLFVPHRGRLRTLRVRHWKALFQTVTLLTLLALCVGAVFTVRTMEENRTLKALMEEENAAHVESLASLNEQLAGQTTLIRETSRTLSASENAADKADRTLDSYQEEYEDLIVAYIDTQFQASSISRGETDSTSFREDVGTLRALLETAETAALDAEREDTALAATSEQLSDVVRHLPSFWPTVADAQVYSEYGRRFHPVYRYYKKHDGVDIGENKGDPIYAAGAGIVTKAEWHAGYGNLVEIDHGNGYITRYGHCSKLLVKVGQEVDQGDEIAKMGETGTATGPHLHFEIRINGATVDPLPYIRD